MLLNKSVGYERQGLEVTLKESGIFQENIDSKCAKDRLSELACDMKFECI